MKICFIGPNGSGKSTAAEYTKEYFINKNFTAEIHKLALPLYELQNIIYDRIGMKIDLFKQNHLVLENLADLLRKISPFFIINDFFNRINNSSVDVIINDDLRDYNTDYYEMKKMGFKFISIKADEQLRQIRLNERNDIHSIIKSKLDKNIKNIIPDFTIYNNTQDIHNYKKSVYSIMDKIIESGKHEN